MMAYLECSDDEWTGHYDLARRNCVHLSDWVARRLHLAALPDDLVGQAAQVMQTPVPSTWWSGCEVTQHGCDVKNLTSQPCCVTSQPLHHKPFWPRRALWLFFSEINVTKIWHLAWDLRDQRSLAIPRREAFATSSLTPEDELRRQLPPKVGGAALTKPTPHDVKQLAEGGRGGLPIQP